MATETELRAYLQKATRQLHDMQQGADEISSQISAPIAIVGMSCRFPGGIVSPPKTWEQVFGGKDSIWDLLQDTGWQTEEIFDPDPDKYWEAVRNSRGFLDGAGVL